MRAVCGIRVIVADDQRLVREAIARLLDCGEDILVVGQASGADELVRMCRELRPDVVVLDTQLPGGRCAQLVSAVLEASRDTQVVALADRSSRQCAVLNPPPIVGACMAMTTSAVSVGTAEDCLVRCLKAGARGALRKDASAQELVSAVRAVHAGQYWIEMPTASRYIEALKKHEGGEPDNGSVRLTEREAQIVGLIVEGMSNREIAQALGISQQTVKNHVSRILEKLELNGRLQIAMHALRSGLAPHEQ
ncbi:MAG: LuxR C-terminal-related transcriptional regulator [Armatimonadota bacterium]